MASLDGGGTTWLPESFVERLSAALSAMARPELEALRTEISEAIAAKQPTVPLGDLDVPARPEFVKLLDENLTAGEDVTPPKLTETDEPTIQQGPLVLETIDNFDERRWTESIRPRTSFTGREVPKLVRTPLKNHQVDSFRWQVSAWEAGLPGILSADEQGLGKTLQTITFLSFNRDGDRRDKP